MHGCVKTLPSANNEAYSFQLFVVVLYSCLVWDMRMLPSNAPCYSKLAIFEGARW